MQIEMSSRVLLRDVPGADTDELRTREHFDVGNEVTVIPVEHGGDGISVIRAPRTYRVVSSGSWETAMVVAQ